MREHQRLRRLWMIGVVILIIIGGALAFILRPRMPKVQVWRVTTQTLQNKIFASGTVHPATRQVILPTQLVSAVQAIPVHVGEHVRSGQLLVSCQHAAQWAALVAAKQSVQASQSALATVNAQAQSAPPGLAPQFAATLASAETSVAQATAQLAQAQEAYDATQIFSSISGTVLFIHPDGIAADGTQAPILEIAGDTKQVVFDVSEADAITMKLGMSATVTSEAFPNEQWTATILRIAPYAVVNSAGTGQVEVTLTSPNGFPVPYGYQVDVHVITITHHQVPVVPYSALIQSGTGYAVFIVKDHQVHKVDVKLGITTDTMVEVDQGVKVGDDVVVNPSANLNDGQTVTFS